MLFWEPATLLLPSSTGVKQLGYKQQGTGQHQLQLQQTIALCVLHEPLAPYMRSPLEWRHSSNLEEESRTRSSRYVLRPDPAAAASTLHTLSTSCSQKHHGPTIYLAVWDLT